MYWLSIINDWIKVSLKNRRPSRSANRTLTTATLQLHYIHSTNVLCITFRFRSAKRTSKGWTLLYTPLTFRYAPLTATLLALHAIRSEYHLNIQKHTSNQQQHQTYKTIREYYNHSQSSSKCILNTSYLHY